MSTQTLSRCMFGAYALRTHHASHPHPRRWESRPISYITSQTVLSPRWQARARMRLCTKATTYAIINHFYRRDTKHRGLRLVRALSLLAIDTTGGLAKRRLSFICDCFTLGSWSTQRNTLDHLFPCCAVLLLCFVVVLIIDGQVVLLLSKILGHVGELLSEYRELGDLLESGAYDESPSPSSSSLECATKGVTRKLTARQELLHQRFQNERQSFLRGYRNFAKEQPHETAAYYIRQVLP